MKKKILTEKTKHVTPEYLIRTQYLDRSKFNYYGSGCSLVKARGGPSMRTPKKLG